MDSAARVLDLLFYMKNSLIGDLTPQVQKQMNDLIKAKLVPMELLNFANSFTDSVIKAYMIAVLSLLEAMVSGLIQNAFTYFSYLSQNNPIITVYESGIKGDPALIKHRQRVRGNEQREGLARR